MCQITVTEPVYEYVDLGLSVKWATCNVGASKPKEYGEYFAWGETETKTSYDWASYKWCNGSSVTLIKYNTTSSYGSVDNKTTLDLEDDVAHVMWGGSWRMPTIAELQELHNNCTWTWYSSDNTEFGGIAGYKVTGYSGRSIFLPAAGYFDGTNLNEVGYRGLYWSSSLMDSPGIAWNINFRSYHVSTGYAFAEDCRNYGFTVRPVCP